MPRPDLSTPDTAFGPVPEANRPGHHPEVEQDKPTGPPPGPRAAAMVQHVAFRFEPLLLPLAAPFGVLPMTTGIDVGDEVAIRFGPWRMRFPREDVLGCEVTGPYNLIKVAGPPHLSLADWGVTFATNREEGLCIRLARPHRALDPLGILRHPSVTVTVEGVGALAALLG